MSTHTDMPELEYHARPELSASIAKRLIEPGGPARWKWEHDHGRAETKAFDLGHAAHTLVLGAGTPIARIPDELLASNGATSTKATTIETPDGPDIAWLTIAEAQQLLVQLARLFREDGTP